MRGVFIGVNGTSIDFERLIWRQVVAGRPSHMAGRLDGEPSTDSGFSFSCRHVATKVWAEPPQTMAGRPLAPLSMGSSPLRPHVKYTLVVMMILTFDQLHFVIP
jgi:hypothetical protein